MNLEPDDPRLTAYVLGECLPDEAADIARAIAADRALGLAVRETESVERLLSSTLSNGGRKLSPRQRAAILSAAREIDAEPVVQRPTHPRRIIAPWLAPLATAALIVLGFYLFIPDADIEEAPSTTNSDSSLFPISMLPTPGPMDSSDAHGGGGSAPAAAASPLSNDGRPVLRFRGPVSAAHHPMLALPIQSGYASNRWITETIMQQGKLPSADAVRSEEILNHFRIRPVGATAIHKGLTLSVETLPCPWKPDSFLAIIAIRGARESVNEITATWHADADAVWRYRLIGHAMPVGVAPRPLPRTLHAAAEHILVLEIEPTSSTLHGFGSIEWTVNGDPAPSLGISANPSRNPSVDARFATFVCAFCEWLRVSSGESRIDTHLVQSMLREAEKDPPFPRRTEFQQLVRKALEIVGED